MVERFLTLCLLLGITASPVWACGVLDHADPKVGGNAKGPIGNIHLTFSEAIVPAKSSIELDDELGKPVESKPFTVSENDTVMSLSSLQPMAAGAYKVHWRVQWKDCGSIMDGHYGFMVTP